MAAILKTFAGLNFYTRTCFIDYYHISFKKCQQTLRPRSCRVKQKFGPWISDYFIIELFDCSWVSLNAMPSVNLIHVCPVDKRLMESFSSTKRVAQSINSQVLTYNVQPFSATTTL